MLVRRSGRWPGVIRTTYVSWPRPRSGRMCGLQLPGWWVSCQPPCRLMEIALQKARVAVVGVKPVDGDRPACPRCLQFEDELRELRRRLMDSGRYVAFSPGPNPNPNVDSELQRWLSVNPRADAAAGFRAGWTRLARFIAPRLRE